MDDHPNVMQYNPPILEDDPLRVTTLAFGRIERSIKHQPRATELTKALVAGKKNLDDMPEVLNSEKIVVPRDEYTLFLFSRDVAEAYPSEIATQLCLRYLKEAKIDDYLSLLLFVSQCHEW